MSESQRFWKAYQENRLSAFERTSDEYHGYIYDAAGETEFRISVDDFTDYDYESDDQFSVGVYSRFSDAASVVLSSRLMKKSGFAHLQELELLEDLIGISLEDEEYETRRNELIERMEVQEIPSETVSQAIFELQPNEDAYKEYENAGDLKYLNVGRAILFKAMGVARARTSFAAAAKNTIDGRRTDDDVIVALAVWSLGRLNQKDAIQFLITLLADSSAEYLFPTVELALQYMCSGDRLIPTSGTPESPVDYWTTQVKALPTDPAGWREWDAKSVFWQKRLRTVLEQPLVGTMPDFIRRIAGDEVGPVSRAANHHIAWADLEPKVISSAKQAPAAIALAKSRNEVVKWQFEIDSTRCLIERGDDVVSSFGTANFLVEWSADGILSISGDSWFTIDESCNLEVLWQSSEGWLKSQIRIDGPKSTVLELSPIDEVPPKPGDVILLRLRKEAFCIVLALTFGDA